MNTAHTHACRPFLPGGPTLAASFGLPGPIFTLDQIFYDSPAGRVASYTSLVSMQSPPLQHANMQGESGSFSHTSMT